MNAPDAHYWMQEALQIAAEAPTHGEVPIGAVIIKDGVCVARAHNWRETLRDPTAHAEQIAIRSASQALGDWRLTDCDLYVTLEPCLMCSGAILLSRLRSVVFGAYDEKGGALISRAQVLQSGIWNHHPIITGGILADECGMILKDFFRKLRM